MKPENRKTSLPVPEPIPADCVAFAVVQHGKMFIPTRLEIKGGVVVEAKQIAPAGPYKPIAWQYLSGKVLEFYSASQLKEAREASKAKAP